MSCLTGLFVAQVLYRQGNVSDFRNDYEGGACWITANNEGFLVIQVNTFASELAQHVSWIQIAVAI